MIRNDSEFGLFKLECFWENQLILQTQTKYKEYLGMLIRVAIKCFMLIKRREK